MMRPAQLKRSLAEGADYHQSSIFRSGVSLSVLWREFALLLCA
ncbi:hypothetical protein P7L53_01515 [Thermoleptolyngbya sichuanensis XZ-Cy5]|nr:hypothetical protein [Thermoleptolyngbya sichuanensis]MDG2614913.1 hypothetical protein [Thermoleptolyngbya sichuanensis XZ-Cy5]